MQIVFLDKNWTKAKTVDSNGRKCGMKFVLVNQETGNREIRTYDYSYSFGNFSGFSFRMKGIRYSGLPESFPDEETGLPVISHYSAVQKK